jgi:hypothetical protein
MPFIPDATSQKCLGLGHYQLTGFHTTDLDTAVPSNLRPPEIITCGHFLIRHETTLWTLVKIAWSYSLTPAYVFIPRSLITRTDNFLCRNELSVLKTSLKRI